ncbi:hypothetical protein G7Z17_g891 [Cylindrodendrum hubeiense]|uniref:non-specific serine/threonine protein kinase n=1 Tax=Cylindrodendrum hubeiense TaxID=595255 RepID=A0A9P5HME3_9HYPO|nr:hypothetical protein G7Z17_g891 [Cylindrodendrum hubeiense]
MGGGRLEGDPYGLWVPPPDPRRPEFPYHAGLTLTIQRHNPPPPYGPKYHDGSARKRSHTPPMREVTQSEWCLQHPPEESPSPHPDTTSHSLRVLDEIACKDGRGAQVVRCCLDQDESQVYVAKIYDAFYYDFTYYSAPVDVTWVADMDYRCEAAVYEDLQQAQVDGLLAPKYYGSWTSDVVALIGSDDLRPVRIVLMEWIQGISMFSIIDKNQVATIPPQHRLDIFAATMELYSRLRFHGVSHQDLSPRNVMLIGSDISSQMPRVILIDFNRSVVTTRPNSKIPNFDKALPINPITYLWLSYDLEFHQWIPEPHRSRDQVWKGWLKMTWGDSKEFEPVSGRNRQFYETDEIEISPPLPDVEPEDPSLVWRRD